MAHNGLADGRKERARLRTAVLGLGEMLGWRPREIIAFTEALTDRRWQQCGQAEFEAVLEEYRAIGRVIKAKAERRAARGAPDRLDERERHAPFE